MMRQMYLALLAGAMLLCGQGFAYSHEFVLKPEKDTVAAQEAVSGQVQAAHVFMISEEAEAVGDVALTLAEPFNSVAVKVAEVSGKPWLAYSFTAPSAEPFCLLGWRKPQIWSKTTEGYLAGDRKSLEAKGKTVVQVGKFEKYAKTVYNSQPGKGVLQKPSLQMLEIVAVSDVGGISAGSAAQQFKVLFNGKEISVPVQATYDGFSKEEDAYAQTCEPDAKGVVSVVFDKPGLWLLRAETTVKNPEEGIDNHNIRATVVLPVK